MRALALSLLIVMTSNSLAATNESELAANSRTTTATTLAGIAGGGTIGSLTYLSSQTQRHFAGEISPTLVTGLMFTALSAGVTLQVACLLNERHFRGEHISDRLSNCLTAPLRIFNRDPRDQMYLEHIASCSPKRIEVGVASRNGRAETRTFTIRDNRLVLVEVRGLDAPYELALLSDGRAEFNRAVITEESGTEFQTHAGGPALYRRLEKDLMSYQILCNRPDLSAFISSRRDSRLRATNLGNPAVTIIKRQEAAKRAAAEDMSKQVRELQKRLN